MKRTRFKVVLTLFSISLLGTFLMYPYFATQVPSKLQPVQSISTFRILPMDVKYVGRKGESPDYLTFSLVPNSSTQWNTEYTVQVNYRDTGALRGQISAAWNQQDTQSKRSLLVPLQATQEELKNYLLQTAYWDGVHPSTQSQDFSFKYTFRLFSINGQTEPQLVDQQNQQQLQRYQQQLTEYAERKTQANRVLFIFIPLDAILLTALLYLSVVKKSRGVTEGLRPNTVPVSPIINVAPVPTSASEGNPTHVASGNIVEGVMPAQALPPTPRFLLKGVLLKALQQMDKIRNPYSNEDEANKELASCLNMTGYKANYHYPLGNRTVDILCEDSLIEGKLEPNHTDKIDRLIGQVDDYVNIIL